MRFLCVFYRRSHQCGVDSTADAETIGLVRRGSIGCRDWLTDKTLSTTVCYRSPYGWVYDLYDPKVQYYKVVPFCKGDFYINKMENIMQFIDDTYPNAGKDMRRRMIYVGPCPCRCSWYCDGKSNFIQSKCPAKKKFEINIGDFETTTETKNTSSIVVRSTSSSKKYSLSEYSAETKKKEGTVHSKASESTTERYPSPTTQDKIGGKISSSPSGGTNILSSSQHRDGFTNSPVVELSSEIGKGYTEITSPEVENSVRTSTISSDSTSQGTSSVFKTLDTVAVSTDNRQTLGGAVSSTDNEQTLATEKGRESTTLHLHGQTTLTRRSVHEWSTEPALMLTTRMDSSEAALSSDGQRSTSYKTTLATIETSSNSSSSAAAITIQPDMVTSRKVLETSETSLSSLGSYKATIPQQFPSTPPNRKIWTSGDLVTTTMMLEASSDGAVTSVTTPASVRSTISESEHSAAPQDNVTRPAEFPLTSESNEVSFKTPTPGGSRTPQRASSSSTDDTRVTPQPSFHSTMEVLSSKEVPEITTTTTASRRRTSTHQNYSASLETSLLPDQSTPSPLEDTESTRSIEQESYTQFTSSPPTLNSPTKLPITTSTKINEVISSEVEGVSTGLSGYDTVDTFSPRQWPTSTSLGVQFWFTSNSTENSPSTLSPSESYSWKSVAISSAHWLKSSLPSVNTSARVDCYTSRTSSSPPVNTSSSKLGPATTVMNSPSDQKIYSTTENENYSAVDSSLTTREVHLSTQAPSSNEARAGTVSHASSDKVSTTVTKIWTDHPDLTTNILTEMLQALKNCQDESDSDLADEIDLRNPEVIQVVRMASQLLTPTAALFYVNEHESKTIKENKTVRVISMRRTTRFFLDVNATAGMNDRFTGVHGVCKRTKHCAKMQCNLDDFVFYGTDKELVLPEINLKMDIGQKLR
ncbi:hypothetical protein ANCDUO_06752 [Ancylostoma duodenale]|uniref:Uncharacterized protein n=1 Tax=Ancylostoma duodenale TaxID=51022 RepID=A0A0C2GVB0_9BILA|nr:hypothetical protein ANCDUO_06752 [Ancylostoma duodenale]